MLVPLQSKLRELTPDELRTRVCGVDATVELLRGCTAFRFVDNSGATVTIADHVAAAYRDTFWGTLQHPEVIRTADGYVYGPPLPAPQWTVAQLLACAVTGSPRLQSGAVPGTITVTVVHSATPPLQLTVDADTKAVSFWLHQPASGDSSSATAATETSDSDSQLFPLSVQLVSLLSVNPSRREDGVYLDVEKRRAGGNDSEDE